MPIRTAVPGVVFQAQSPPPTDVLPRMDIAGFVGFAETGPLHKPVLVEDMAGFTAVFGAPVRLFRDAVTGESVSGHLADAVRAFFSVGGRRCWVVRVAAAATRGTIPLPGMAVVDTEGGGQARLRARSAGSWFDDVTVAVGLSARGVAATGFRFVGDKLTCTASDVRVGDMLRLGYGSTISGLFVVSEVRRSTVTCAPSAWWQLVAPVAAPLAGTAMLSTPVPVTITDDPAGQSGDVVLELPVALADAPAPGTLLRVRLSGQPQALVLVGQARTKSGSASAIVLSGQLIRQLATGPSRQPDAVAVLTVELRSRGKVVTDLGLAPAHPRYLGTLPTDDEPAWSQTMFPVAGVAGSVYYPVGVPALDGLTYVQADRMTGRKLERDGLGRFTADLFGDKDLRDTSVLSLLTTADYIRDQSPNPRPLQGIYALLDIDEVTLVAAPDCVHRPWQQAPAELPPAPPPHKTYRPPVECSRTGQDFQDRANDTLDAPVFAPAITDSVGDVHLSWTSAPASEFVVEESVDPSSWDQARECYRGKRPGVDLFGHSPGIYFYRVRAEAGPLTSDWSAGLTVVLSTGEPWIRVGERDFTDQVLVGVQRELTMMSAARGDMFAVLATPAHYRDADAAAHVARLRTDDRTSSFGALYHPWPVLSTDTAQLVTLPPDGPIIGQFAVRALTSGAWVAPANMPLADVVALKPTGPTGFTPQLNQLRDTPRGFLVLAADTLSADPDLGEITVRRLLSLLRRLAVKEAPPYVFEPNGPAVRSSLRRKFEQVLADLLARGAFAGATAADSYRVATPESGVEGQLIVELRVAPSVPMRFLLVRLTHVGDGELNVEVS